MKYANNLSTRHLWRGEVGTSFFSSRPLPLHGAHLARQAIPHL
jgi:hypothetical protein